jgi:hypothetical protein
MVVQQHAGGLSYVMRHEELCDCFDAPWDSWTNAKAGARGRRCPPGLWGTRGARVDVQALAAPQGRGRKGGRWQSWMRLATTHCINCHDSKGGGASRDVQTEIHAPTEGSGISNLQGHAGRGKVKAWAGKLARGTQGNTGNSQNTFEAL